MDYIPDDIFDDLMLDMVGKYKGPPIAASDLQGLAVETQPKILKPDYAAQGQQSCDRSWAKMASEPQKKIFNSLPHHNDSPQFGSFMSNEHVLGSQWLSSNLNSKNNDVLQRISDSHQSGTVANINEQAFSNRSTSSYFDTKNVAILPARADHWPSGSLTSSTMLAPSSLWLSSCLDSSVHGISPGLPVSLRSDNSAEFNEQSFKRHSKSQLLETKKVTFFQTHEDHLRYTNSAESNVLTPNSHQLSSSVDYRNDINMPRISDNQQPARAAEVSKQALSNRSQSSFLSTRKVTILTDQDESLRLSSSANSKVPDPSNLLKPSTLQSKIDSISSLVSECRQSVSTTEVNKQDSSVRSKSSSSETRKVTFLLEHDDPRQSGSPAESNVQKLNNRLTSSPLNSRNVPTSLKLAGNLQSCIAGSSGNPDSSSSPVSLNQELKKETAFLKHADSRLSSSPARSIEIVSGNCSELKGVDSIKASPLLDYIHQLPPSCPEDSKKQLSTSPLESKNNQINHDEGLESLSYNKKKNGIAEIAKTDVHRAQPKGKKIKEDYLQQLKERIDDPEFIRICWKQLIKWADMNNEHDLRSDVDRCNLQTETFKSLIASFRCPPTPAHHQYCFASVGEGLRHATFKSPSLDHELFAICNVDDEKDACQRLLQKIYPLDKDLEKIQNLIMKAIIPLFLVCNAYEVSSAGSQKQTPMSVYLCRHSLVLFGQIFSLISSMRQDRVLEALNLHGNPPQPSRYPNLDSACLFGHNYMSKLSLYMGKSQLPSAGLGGVPIKEENVTTVDTTHFDATVDGKNKAAIEKLAQFVAEMGLEMEVFNTDKLASNPNFWFLNKEQSPEYKFYYVKLAEFRQSFSSGSRKDQDSQFKKPNIGSPQSLLKSSGDTTTSKTDCFTPPLLPPLRKRKAAQNTVTAPPKKQSQEETPKVDAKTRDTAEKLARFVVRMGPEMDRFTKAEVSNPQFWFLNQKDHPAYKYYQMKLDEFSKAKQTPAGPSDHKTPVLEKCSTTGPKNTANEAKEPQGALLLLSELYDSDEEESPTEDDVHQDSKHHVRRHQKYKLRNDSAARDSKRTSSRHSSRIGYR